VHHVTSDVLLLSPLAPEPSCGFDSTREAGEVWAPVVASSHPHFDLLEVRDGVCGTVLNGSVEPGVESPDQEVTRIPLTDAEQWYCAHVAAHVVDPDGSWCIVDYCPICGVPLDFPDFDPFPG